MQAVATTAGLITFTHRADNVYVISLDGKKTIKVYFDRKNALWSCEWHDSGALDLVPFVLEDTPEAAYQAALERFWGIQA